MFLGFVPPPYGGGHQFLHALRRERCRRVHRVDGPVSIYRGSDDGIDRRFWEINRELADVTIFQSEYSRSRHVDLGLVFKDASVIHNAADPAIFHARGRAPFDRTRKVRLITTSWSDNAEQLRSHDVFIPASLHESCSNALIEALSCGLPVIFVDSGSNGELVKDAGLPLVDRHELPARIEQLIAEYDMRQSKIAAPVLSDVADRYLAVMGLPSHPSPA